LFIYLLVIESATLALVRFKGWWWLGLAALAGVLFWPWLWITTANWHTTDALPVGLFLLASAVAYFFARLGWESPGRQEWRAEIGNLQPAETMVFVANLAIILLFVALVRAAGYDTSSLVLLGALAVLTLA